MSTKRFTSSNPARISREMVGRVSSYAKRFTTKTYTHRKGLTVGSLMGAGIAGKAFVGMNKFRDNVMAGLYPGSAYPSAQGRLGLDSNPQQGSAGLTGLRFNFRRK